jgi:aspartyl-tRNA(Asn)/glutamyl-tRNA(Gln) amidotransferase subunit B
MYPDTDSAPVPITDPWVEGLRARLPKPPWEQEAHLVRLGFAVADARSLVRLGRYLAAARLGEQGLSVGAVCRALLQDLVAGARRNAALASMAPARIEELVRAVASGSFAREAFSKVADEAAARPDQTIGQIVGDLGVGLSLEGDALDAEVTRALRDAPRPRSADRPARMRYAMGKVMDQIAGRAHGAAVFRAVDRRLD